jgi:uncharacterized membrane protein YfcA
VLGYALANASTGVPMVVVGASLLFSADLFALKLFVGLFFLLFSVVKLSAAAVGVGKRKLAAERVAKEQAEEAKKPAAAASDLPVGGSEAAAAWEEAAGESLPSPAEAAAADPALAEGAVHKPSAGAETRAEEDGSDLIVVSPVPGADMPTPTSSASTHRSSSLFSSCLSAQIAKLPPISATYSVKATVIAFIISGAFAGLLNGLLGTGGPPQMVVFSILEVDKETIRSMSAIYGAFLLPVRAYMFTQAQGNVFNPDDWPTYLSVAVASWGGFLGGTLLRRRADTDAIIRVLLVLVFASSAILLGALEDAGLAAAYVVGGLLWGGALFGLVLRPGRCPGLIAGWDAAARCGCLRRRG